VFIVEVRLETGYWMIFTGYVILKEEEVNFLIVHFLISLLLASVAIMPLSP